MNQQEFRDFIIKSARKYISEGIELDETEVILKQPEAPKLSKPSFTKKNVNKMPKAPKEPKSPEPAKIAKPTNISESISPDKIKVLAEEMKKINKKIDLRNPLINPELFDIISEGENSDKEIATERWKNLYNYNIPKDESR